SLMIAPEIGEIIADSGIVKKIIRQLLDNGGKFTPAGGVLRLEAGTEGNWLLIRVTDSGRGIVGEDLSRLFQPFTQLDSSLTKEYSGIGMGLYLAQKLATVHNGDIEVVSTVGQGSIFTLRIPLTGEGENTV
ncbi:MAG: hypothetical protein KKD63_12575, partial [Proteobacteria bacterium]|nr:hypothetical protein [Desulfobulbaceae bacterium]MBU4153704.1 hypothetical protein [Pseudomonadota bacterium]